jgi:hypothetical protein
MYHLMTTVTWLTITTAVCVITTVTSYNDHSDMCHLDLWVLLNMGSFTGWSCWHFIQPPSWRTIPSRLSAAAYSIYSQLPSISEVVPPSATWGRAMPWWQGHITCFDLLIKNTIRNKIPRKQFTHVIAYLSLVLFCFEISNCISLHIYIYIYTHTYIHINTHTHTQTHDVLLESPRNWNTTRKPPVVQFCSPIFRDLYPLWTTLPIGVLLWGSTMCFFGNFWKFWVAPTSICIFLQGSVITGTKEDESSTGHVWAPGFHHVTARSRFAPLFETYGPFISFVFFRSAVNRGYWISG